MLTELSVTNFKSWREIRAMRLAPITGLFGANSSGKTSILQLLLMLKQTAESPDRTQPLILGDEKSPANLGTFPDIVFGHADPGRIDFSIAWRPRESFLVSEPLDEGKELFRAESLRFSAGITGNGSARPVVESMSYQGGGYTFGMHRGGSAGQRYELDARGPGFSPLRRVGRPSHLPGPTKCYGFPDQVRADFENVGFLSDLQLAFEEMLGQTYYLGPLREYHSRQYVWAGAEPADMGARGERVIDALLAAAERNLEVPSGNGRGRVPLEQRIAKWLRDLGLIHDFQVKRVEGTTDIYRVHVQATAEAVPVFITGVGFGVSQVLPVLVMCYYVPEGSTILLEQPELHLHPAVQAGLADVFLDAARNRNLQIVIESHSEHLLRRLQRRIAEEQARPEEIALYFCELAGGQSRLTKLEADVFGKIENWPREFFGDEFGEMAAMTRAAMERRKATGL